MAEYYNDYFGWKKRGGQTKDDELTKIEINSKLIRVDEN